ncbi:type I-E CRISPR-associated protein Cas5/CasD [Ezakiella coagulans]|uniref:type I-E CRISPR-associated protein Cas5/CasD n=1 Tax=Ezakiella coagulans TaxID=46507 RepID=UPI002014BEFB|nr:type I-E CRISPR-associated protein Cas5/CasD [Ezakiella coagulans]UQK61486.1 type I-E CRISPR-associated protein Cas5/CasD [Ezakiella coagulans]
MKTILLKFGGPMQSWGTSSHFETRNTDYYPSKSAVIGVIAASFGYSRDEDKKIEKLNELDFAVRVDQVGLLRKDYQTARKLKKDETYVTNRYYLEDAIFVVAISSEDDDWIEEICAAIKNPYFQPFMGRRSCPVQPDFIIDVVEMGAIEALQNLEWQASDWYKRRNQNYVADICADKDLLPESGYTMRNDSVISFSQKERKFGPRFEARTAKTMSAENENQSEPEQFDCYGALEE